MKGEYGRRKKQRPRFPRGFLIAWELTENVDAFEVYLLFKDIWLENGAMLARRDGNGLQLGGDFARAEEVEFVRTRVQSRNPRALAPLTTPLIQGWRPFGEVFDPAVSEAVCHMAAADAEICDSIDRGIATRMDTMGTSDTFVVPDLPAARYREIKAKKQGEQ